MAQLTRWKYADSKRRATADEVEVTAGVSGERRGDGPWQWEARIVIVETATRTKVCELRLSTDEMRAIAKAWQDWSAIPRCPLCNGHVESAAAWLGKVPTCSCGQLKGSVPR